MPKVLYEGTAMGQGDRMRVGKYRFKRGEVTLVDEETARRLAKVNGYRAVRERAAKVEAAQPAEEESNG